MGTADRTDFDTPAAVTRSMLGWGVVAGPLYLVTGLALALTRDGFDLGRHQLSCSCSASTAGYNGRTSC